jgi:hypothetical protein
MLLLLPLGPTLLVAVVAARCVARALAIECLELQELQWGALYNGSSGKYSN